jgi:acetoin utilization deacetylase AcuC-like enzyme
MLADLGLPTILVQEGGYELSALERDLTAILSRFSSAGGADLEL